MSRRKLYGRRKGPKLSQHQASLFDTLLPQLALNVEPSRDPRVYFDSAVEDVWLEIGFGAGEHLLWQAEHHPRVGIIGCEPYEAGMAKLLSFLSPFGGPIATASIGAWGEGAVRRGSPPHPNPLPHRGRGDNIRLHQGDARDVIEALPDASLGRVFLLFPDPWPKTRHHKRRFIQMEMLDQLARVMKLGAEFRFASDDAGYVSWTLERILAHQAFAWTATSASGWKIRSTDWPPTRYEEKALHGVPVFLQFIRK